MTALPPQVPEARRVDCHVISAYDLCLKAEDSLEQAAANDIDIGNDLVYIRILGFLIHFAPTDVGLEVIVNEILSSRADRDLLDVGKMYYDHYLRAFRANRGRIPTPPNYASPPLFDNVTDMINNTLQEASQSHLTAKKHALIRDGFRCVVTGAYDQNSVQTIRELNERLLSDPSLMMSTTECAHIFSPSPSIGIGLDSEKRNYDAPMWAVLSRFGYPELSVKLNSSRAHRLENVMSLNHSLYMAFNQLQVWFVATNEENKYKLAAVNSLFLRNCPEYVTFTTPDPVQYPVPSPKYLAIHAACAQVAHLSGAAKCIDKFYEDMEYKTTLDPDGASAEMLEHAIFELQAAGFPIAS